VVDEKQGLGNPEEFFLFQNYPNPFNSNTSISFRLPVRGKVVLSIFNELGERVTILMDGEKEAGYHSIEWNAANMTSDVYFYELKTNNNCDVKKLLSMK
jgi:flagellar hook assembly protein FlgD